MLDTAEPLAHVPTLSLSDNTADPNGFAAALGASFERFGFAVVADHGIPADLITRAWAQTEALFALSEAEKRAQRSLMICVSRAKGQRIVLDL